MTNENFPKFLEICKNNVLSFRMLFVFLKKLKIVICWIQISNQKVLKNYVEKFNKSYSKSDEVIERKKLESEKSSLMKKILEFTKHPRRIESDVFFCAIIFLVCIREAHDGIPFHSAVCYRFFPVLDDFFCRSLLHRLIRARKHQSKAMAAMTMIRICALYMFDSIIIICSTWFVRFHIGTSTQMNK